MHTIRAHLAAIIATLLVAAGCGSTESTSGDAAEDDTGSTDTTETVDTATDTSSDVPTDTGTDTVEDTTTDTAADTVEDTATDDAGTECEAAGGYCTEYPVIPDSCVTCDSTGVTHYRPAHNPLGAMGCTVEGVGGSPWCCLPHETGTSDCEMAGGECYPYADPEPCPPGWGAIWSDCGAGEGVICCAPASENCD
jgi:hypothetical protein